jgi:cytochrome b6
MVKLEDVYNWLDNRFGLKMALELASHKEVPVHKHSIWYYMGGMIMVLIGVQVVTGILLLIYYVPDIKSAHASILLINSQVEFGWFIRSLHSWGANLAVAAAFIHMFSTLLMKAYRPPREFTWLFGMALLVLMMGFGFTGYLLPWDEIAFFASKIGLDITSKAPIVGEMMAYILRGGEAIGQNTLSRFFAIHVIVLPIALMALLGGHLMMVQLHGMSEPEVFKKLPKEKKEYEKFFPTFLLKDFMVWILVLNLLAVFVTMSPWGIGPEADPFAAAPIGIKPEWYFLAMYQFLKLVPSEIAGIEGDVAGVGFFGLVGLALAALPFIDRGHSKKVGQVVTALSILFILGFVFFTIWGVLS